MAVIVEDPVEGTLDGRDEDSVSVAVVDRSNEVVGAGRFLADRRPEVAMDYGGAQHLSVTNCNITESNLPNILGLIAVQATH